MSGGLAAWPGTEPQPHIRSKASDYSPLLLEWGRGSVPGYFLHKISPPMKSLPVFGILLSLLAPTVACADAFAGVVKDSSGHPLSGASVFVQWGGGWWPEPPFDGVRVRTDARGAFHATTTFPPCRINGITIPYQEPHRWAVTALVPGYAVSTVRVQDSARNIAITLAPETRLNVHLQNEDGHPIAGVDPALDNVFNSGPLHSLMVRPTDAAGNTTVTNLPRSAHLSLRITNPYWMLSSKVKQSASVALGDTAVSSPVTVVLRKTSDVGVVLHGRIVTEDGKPVVGCKLTTQTMFSRGVFNTVSATSGAYGNFRFPPLPRGDLTVDVDGPVPAGYALPRDYFLQLPASGLAEPWIITADRGVLVTGRVLDDRTSQPIANAVIHGADEMHDTTLPLAETGHDGRFQMRLTAERWIFDIFGFVNGRATDPGLAHLDARGHNGETKDLGDIRVKSESN